MSKRTDRAESIFVYVEVMPGGAEGIVGALVPGMGMTPLVTSRANLLPAFDELARQHARANGCAVELRQYRGPADVLKVFDREGGG
jgi:hypothetical protein